MISVALAERLIRRAMKPAATVIVPLTAVSVAALTVYDMCKAVSQGIVICDIRLLKKTGGKSDYRA